MPRMGVVTLSSNNPRPPHYILNLQEGMAPGKIYGDSCAMVNGLVMNGKGIKESLERTDIEIS